MKAVILAGGLGTRLSEETVSRPKPMVEIGGKPILWHIMKIYLSHGIDDFIICCGYKGYVIKEYFANYYYHTADVTFDFTNNVTSFHSKKTEPWKVTIIETGENTQTGGRLKRVGEYLDDESFCFTYGDGVSNINITSLIEFHKAHGKSATVTAVVPPGRFGALDINGDQVLNFTEKPLEEKNYINGGFFVLEKNVLSTIEHDNVAWESHPLTGLAQKGQLMSFKHHGFWYAMDTLRDQRYLESLWMKGEAPWKTW